PVKGVSGFAPVPLIVSCSETVTTTLPARPEPKALLEISPLLTIDNVPAVTLTFPAFPVLPITATAAIAVGGFGVLLLPTIARTPGALTETSPLLPIPPVLLAIAPLLTMDNVPALNVTLPALPAPMRAPTVNEPMPFNTEEAAPTDMSIETGPATVTDTSP